MVPKPLGKTRHEAEAHPPVVLMFRPLEAEVAPEEGFIPLG
jgi:hypothetical protein